MFKYLQLFAVLLFLASCNTGGDSEVYEQKKSEETQMMDDLQKNPDSLLLRETVIQFYRDKGDYTSALKYTREGIQRDSINARWFQIEGTLLYETEDTLGAITSFENAARIIPAPQLLYPLGIMYAQTGRKDALNVAQALQQSETPDPLQADFIRGVYFANVGDDIQALKYLNACLDVNHTFMDAYREKAIIYFNNAQYKSSIDVLEKAITLQNNFDVGYYWLGRNYEKLNQKEKAIENYQRALLYDPQYIEAKEALQQLQPNTN